MKRGIRVSGHYAFDIFTPGFPVLPFMIYRSRIGSGGWTVIGQVLF